MAVHPNLYNHEHPLEKGDSKEALVDVESTSAAADNATSHHPGALRLQEILHRERTIGYFFGQGWAQPDFVQIRHGLD